MSGKKVAVIGASGKTGFAVVKKLVEAGQYEVTAVIRDAKKSHLFDGLSIADIVVIPLEETVSKFALALKDFDIVVFTAGTKNLANFDEVVTVDLDGAIKIIEACESGGVKRLVLTSSIDAMERDFWSESRTAKVYYMCKRAVDKILTQTKDLEYTIIEPGPLVDEDGTGKIMIPKDAYIAAMRDFNWGENYLAIKVPREDVASTIVEALNNDKTIGKTIPVVGGEYDIKDVIENYL